MPIADPLDPMNDPQPSRAAILTALGVRPAAQNNPPANPNADLEQALANVAASNQRMKDMQAMPNGGRAPVEVEAGGYHVGDNAGSFGKAAMPPTTQLGRPPVNPHHPNLSREVPAGFDLSRTLAQQFLDRDTAQRSAEGAAWGAEQMAAVPGSENASQAWLAQRHPERSLPSTPHGAMGASSSGGINDSKQQAMRERMADPNYTQNIAKKRFGGAYNSVVGAAASDRSARKERLGKPDYSPMLNALGIDPAGNQPVGDPQVRQLGQLAQLAGPDVATMMARNQGFGMVDPDMAIQREQSMLAMYSELLSRGIPDGEAWQTARERFPGPSFGPQVNGPQQAGGMPITPTPSPGVGSDPNTASRTVTSLTGTPEEPGVLSTIGVTSESSSSDVESFLNETYNTPAQVDEQTLERLVTFLKARAVSSLDPKYLTGIGSPLKAMMEAAPGQRYAAYDAEMKRLESQNTQSEYDRQGPSIIPMM